MRRETRDELLLGFLAINAMLQEEVKTLRHELDGKQKEANYNPNWARQPRAPRGVPEGGQWIDGGSAPKQAVRRDRSSRTQRPWTGRVTAPEREAGSTTGRLGPTALRATAISLPLQLSGSTPRSIINSRIVAGTTDLLVVDVLDRQSNRRRITFQRIVEPERRVPVVAFGVDTGFYNVEPARVEILDVEASFSGNDIVFDQRELAQAYGREIPGVTTTTASDARPSLQRPPPGFAIETFDEEEAGFVAAWRAAGRSPQQIQAGLETLRRNREYSAPSSLRRRNEPGVAHTTRSLPTVRGRWLRGSQRNAGVIPGQIAVRLQGRTFDNFGQFRQAFWREVANTPELARQFTFANVIRMSRGLAPVPPRTQWFGGQSRYIIHHRDPIARGGNLYDMSNMLIVTPRYHHDVLARRHHFGGRRRRP